MRLLESKSMKWLRLLHDFKKIDNKRNRDHEVDAMALCYRSMKRYLND